MRRTQSRGRGDVFLVLLPYFSYRPFPGTVIPSECKPWSNVKHKHLIDWYCCQYRKRSISSYVQGSLLTSFTTEVTLGKCKNSQMVFPHLKTLAGRCSHCCYFDTGFVLQLVQLTALIQQFQWSEVLVLSHRSLNNVLADADASSPCLFFQTPQTLS